MKTPYWKKTGCVPCGKSMNHGTTCRQIAKVESEANRNLRLGVPPSFTDTPLHKSEKIVTTPGMYKPLEFNESAMDRQAAERQAMKRLLRLQRKGK